MLSKTLQPARIAFDAGGAPYSEDFTDVYHSVDGGPAQARAVFLAGNGLPQRWRGRRSFTILETGFGLGLNFLCCAGELLADPDRPSRLNYVAVEKHPALPGDLARAHARWPHIAGLAEELRRAWPAPLRGFHRIDLAGGRIALTLLFGDAVEMLSELDARADAVFLDGFAPEKNPEMWSDVLFRQLARLSGPGTTAATWSVAATVRARLQSVGFQVDKRPGFGRKREMLGAIRPGAVASRGSAAARERHAVVIGAGLAGSWAAHALASRGWTVDLIERHPEPAQEASGNAVGAVRPALNLADNDNARLARAAFLRATRVLDGDPAWSQAYRRTGVLHVATTAQQAGRMAAILAAHAFPPQYVRWVETDEGARLARHRVAGPGWWLADGGWARPQALCRALLGLGADRIRAQFGSAAHDFVPSPAGWRVRDAGGKVLAQAPVLVLANGYDARRFDVARLPMLVGVRGQVSFVPPAPNRVLDIVVCGDGYIAPLPGGGHCVGATFEPDVEAVDLRNADHASNLQRAQRMLPGFGLGLDPARLGGWAGLRAATADRLPVCGALSSADTSSGASNCYILAGMGARGLIWAPLCA
ncbi:MAG: FAD-dependent 5-carboxymethylaminomethyl-2-thiouridine(34) oxidoreductase MnmC, partial [Burkholderiales bacterium]